MSYHMSCHMSRQMSCHMSSDMALAFLSAGTQYQQRLFLPVLSRQEPVRCQIKCSSHDNTCTVSHTHTHAQLQGTPVNGKCVCVLWCIELASDRIVGWLVTNILLFSPTGLQHWQQWQPYHSTRAGSRNQWKHSVSLWISGHSQNQI